MEEVWKDIDGYPNYQVSNIGRVRSLPRVTYSPNHAQGSRSITVGGCMKSTKPNAKGYPRVTLMNAEGVMVSRNIHRFVAIAFIPNPENKPQVNHINGIKTDNKVENLEWVTISENVKHAFDTGLKKSYHGLRDRMKTLGESFAKTTMQYDSDGNYIATFKSATDAANTLGLRPKSISRVCRGERSHYKGHVFKYSNQ